MKKTVLMIACALATSVAFAQDMNSKRGVPILPEAGDWSVGFNAVPFIDWAFDKTRIMSNTPASSAADAMNYQIDQTLVLQKMKAENKAMRLKVRFETESHKLFNDVNKFNSSSTPPEKVQDSKVVKQRTIEVTYGTLTYRGKGRVKGFYGYEGFLSLDDGGRTTYEYGNAIGSDNQAPVTTTWDASGNATAGPQSSRDLKVKNAGKYSVGANAVIGVEYFFAPKMSVACEYTWGFEYMRSGRGKTTSEAWDATSNSVKETESEGSRGSRNADIQVGNDNASINLKFYF